MIGAFGIHNHGTVVGAGVRRAIACGQAGDGSLVVRCDAATPPATTDTITEHGPQAFAHTCDTAQHVHAGCFIETVEGTSGPMGILVNSAGAGSRVRITEYFVAALQQVATCQRYRLRPMTHTKRTPHDPTPSRHHRQSDWQRTRSGRVSLVPTMSKSALPPTTVNSRSNGEVVACG